MKSLKSEMLDLLVMLVCACAVFIADALHYPIIAGAAFALSWHASKYMEVR